MFTCWASGRGIARAMIGVPDEPTTESVFTGLSVDIAGTEVRAGVVTMDLMMCGVVMLIPDCCVMSEVPVVFAMVVMMVGFAMVVVVRTTLDDSVLATWLVAGAGDVTAAAAAAETMLPWRVPDVSAVPDGTTILACGRAAEELTPTPEVVFTTMAVGARTTVGDGRTSWVVAAMPVLTIDVGADTDAIPGLEVGSVIN